MPASALREVFRAVVIAKLCYASSIWLGFSKAGDNQRVTAFIRRSIRQGYCTMNLADITSFIIGTADDILFRQILKPYFFRFYLTSAWQSAMLFYCPSLPACLSACLCLCLSLRHVLVWQNHKSKSHLSASTPPKKLTRITDLDHGNTIVSLPNCTAASLSSEYSTNIHIDCSY